MDIILLSKRLWNKPAILKEAERTKEKACLEDISLEQIELEILRSALQQDYDPLTEEISLR